MCRIKNFHWVYVKPNAESHPQPELQFSSKPEMHPTTGDENAPQMTLQIGKNSLLVWEMFLYYCIPSPLMK